jgi:ABC-type Fe3+-hydroxamate transport system substrate-binding protein
MGALAMGRVRTALVTAGALVLLLAGTACGERAEPTGALVQVFPVTVQGGGERPTVLRSAPRRIVPVGAGPRRILKALGLQRRTVAVNDTLVGLPLVGEIRRAKPDLIVASSDTDPLDLARARTATNAAVYVETSSSLGDVVAAIGDIGLATGRPIQARRLTAAIEAKRRAVAAELSGTGVVTVFVDDGDFSTISTRSLLGGLIEEARGRSVAGPSPEQGPFPLRRLLQLDPDVYLATAESGRTLRQLRSRAGTKRLRAIRTGRFAIVPADASIAGPQIGRGLEEVARMLHPDAVR